VASNAQSVTYRTVAPIPKRAIDAVVQYYVQAEFTGLYSEQSSPKTYRIFTNPAHYEPRDLNAELAPVGTNRIPYYFVFSCLPGQVWINELTAYGYYDWDLNAYVPGPYVELCGVENVQIGQWQLKTYDTTPSLRQTYTVTNGFRLANWEDSGFGFWVLGDPATMASPPRNASLTSPLRQEGGGIKLFRSMGALEEAVSYGSAISGFAYIGNEDEFMGASPLSLEGTGSNRQSFAGWQTETYAFTPGEGNSAQTLVAWPHRYLHDDPPQIALYGIWLENNRVAVAASDAPGWIQALLYTTNLQSAWSNVADIATVTIESQNGTNIFSVSLDDLPAGPVYFYRIGAWSE
jgi:hypothetical protein